MAFNCFTVNVNCANDDHLALVKMLKENVREKQEFKRLNGGISVNTQTEGQVHTRMHTHKQETTFTMNAGIDKPE